METKTETIHLNTMDCYRGDTLKSAFYPVATKDYYKSLVGIEFNFLTTYGCIDKPATVCIVCGSAVIFQYLTIFKYHHIEFSPFLEFDINANICIGINNAYKLPPSITLYWE
jgi:hypothetical protein